MRLTATVTRSPGRAGPSPAPAAGATHRGLRETSRRDGRRPADAGAVTAELAVALTAVAVVLAAVLAVGQAVVAQVRCTDAAAAGARAAARGATESEVATTAAALAGEGAVVRVTPVGGSVQVVVHRRVELVLPLTPSLAVEGRAVAAVEEPSVGVGP